MKSETPLFRWFPILFHRFLGTGPPKLAHEEGSFDFEDLPFSPDLRHLLESVEVHFSRQGGCSVCFPRLSRYGKPW